MSWESIGDWMVENWALLVIIAIIVGVIIASKINKARQKREQKKQEEITEPVTTFMQENPLFPKTTPLTSNTTFAEQKKLAEQWIVYLKKKGRELVEGERSVQAYYNDKQKEFRRTRNELGTKYSMWQQQLETINQLITEQERLQQEYKRIGSKE